VIASVCTFALGQMASAADLPRKAPGPPPPPAYSWTGFYVGANVGGGWGDRDVSYSPNDPLMVFLFTPGEGGAPPGVIPIFGCPWRRAGRL
jgi:opacity protein-like surface antigen